MANQVVGTIRNQLTSSRFNIAKEGAFEAEAGPSEQGHSQEKDKHSPKSPGLPGD